jgi:hypothetical protein
MKQLVAIGIAGVLLSSCSSSSSSSSNPTGPSPAPETSTSSSAPPPLQTPKQLWDAPPNAMALTRKAGLVPERIEYLRYHVHAHLDVFVDGRPIVVTPGIGINIDDPGVHAFPLADGSTGYGGIQRPCKQVCISPLHTHDPDGVLHTESRTPEPNRLGQFFVEWGVRLTDTCVGEYCAPETPIAFYVNGNPYELDPRGIELADLTEIAIVIGTPPENIPSVFSG